jgi:hypothetical protein
MRFAIPDGMTVLGKVLDLTLEAEGRTRLIEFTGLWLETDPTCRVIWFVPVNRKQMPVDPRHPALRENEKVFRRWFDFEPRRDWQQRVKLNGTWRLRGDVLRIAYRSDKWTGKKPVDYEHHFTRAPRLYQLGRELYRISGPGLRVGSQGIVG